MRFVGGQDLVDVVADSEFVRQIDGVFERELGARTDGKVRGVRGVAHQHDRHGLAGHFDAMHPVLANHAWEANPVGGATQVLRVADELVAAEVLGKELLAKGDGFRLLHGVESVRLPNLFGCLDDERRSFVVELVRMGLKPAVLGFLESKGEGVEGLVRAEPDEAAVA